MPPADAASTRHGARNGIMDGYVLYAPAMKVDERVSGRLVTHEVSIGDYVLSGGEIPALVVIEAVSRMMPGVVGRWESVATDSHFCGVLGPPQYTRPPSFRGMAVPEVLLRGDHAAIRRFRRKEALRITQIRGRICWRI